MPDQVARQSVKAGRTSSRAAGGRPPFFVCACALEDLGDGSRAVRHSTNVVWRYGSSGQANAIEVAGQRLSLKPFNHAAHA